MRIYIQQDRDYSDIVKYVIRLIGSNTGHTFRFVEREEEAQVRIGDSGRSDVELSYDFYQKIGHKVFQHEKILDAKGNVSNQAGVIDYVATIFYLSNCVQEYHAAADALDQYGRFKYDASCQKKFESTDENLVQQCIDALCVNVFTEMPRNNNPTRLFLSQDIDAIHGSLVHDTLWALKCGKIGKALQCILRNVINGPEWFCIDRIVAMQTKHDVSSTFFWMTEQEKGSDDINNADYNINNPGIVKTIKKCSEQGFDHGLHKSTLETTFKSELDRMPVCVRSNRFHYLKFNLPEAWDELEKSGVALDASLGFAEKIGLRNNYGAPFSPFNFNTGKNYTFVEAPLHVMDVTFEKYMHISMQEAADRTIQFIEKHKQNCVLSILWHNMGFTEYQFEEYLKAYKKILLYIYEAQMGSISTDEIISRYQLSTLSQDVNVA